VAQSGTFWRAFVPLFSFPPETYGSLTGARPFASVTLSLLSLLSRHPGLETRETRETRNESGNSPLADYSGDNFRTGFMDFIAHRSFEGRTIVRREA